MDVHGKLSRVSPKFVLSVRFWNKYGKKSPCLQWRQTFYLWWQVLMDPELHSIDLHWLLLINAYCLPRTHHCGPTTRWLSLCKQTSQSWNSSMSCPTNFLLISCAFPHRRMVMNTCMLCSISGLTKFLLNTDFLLQEWSLTSNVLQ